MKNRRTYYFVEGECEKELINALKENPALIMQGKVKVFNPINKKLTPNDFITILPNSFLVFVFDTDVQYDSILKHNLSMVKKYSKNYKVILIPQVKNFEDELLRSLKVHSLLEITNSKSLSNFKSDFIKIYNLRNVLKKFSFDIKKIWALEPCGLFSKYNQEGKIIKII